MFELSEKQIWPLSISILNFPKDLRDKLNIGFHVVAMCSGLYVFLCVMFASFVHCIYIEFASFVHCIYIEFASFVHCICIISTLYLHWVCIICTLYLHWVCIICTLYLHWVCIICTLYHSFVEFAPFVCFYDEESGNIKNKMHITNDLVMYNLKYYLFYMHRYKIFWSGQIFLSVRLH
jgi:hypothetical protein